MQLRPKARSWSSINPVVGPQSEVLYQDEHGGFHLLVAWQDCRTSVSRATPEEARRWLIANSHEIPRDLK